MNIPPSDLRWYAAFHNETYHPHIHLVAYSVGREPYITEKRLDDLKRTFAKDIFSSVEMYFILLIVFFETFFHFIRLGLTGENLIYKILFAIFFIIASRF